MNTSRFYKTNLTKAIKSAEHAILKTIEDDNAPMRYFIILTRGRTMLELEITKEIYESFEKDAAEMHKFLNGTASA